MSADRRIPLRALAIASAAALVPLGYFAAEALSDLGTARSNLRALSSVEESDPASGHEDRARATRRLTGYLQRLADEKDVQLRTKGGSETGPGTLLVIALTASGTQPATLAFIDAVETGPRGIRLRTWRIGRTSDGIRLTGEAVALASNVR